MLRHSFALRWYLVLSRVWQPHLDGFSDEQLKDLHDQFGDVWYAQVQADAEAVAPVSARDCSASRFNTHSAIANAWPIPQRERPVH
ncbi:hypothetical protein [Streptomyces sp. NPDC059649]|uniref:hypothetical protein n=1 Tax=Streptomyces sp. NPDC059649 TaxID=3346895 RepID=UPI0036BD9E16